ncbi:hypothetical protein SUDANB9_00955 [Streptomyces sp. enrichment culture]
MRRPHRADCRSTASRAASATSSEFAHRGVKLCEREVQFLLHFLEHHRVALVRHDVRYVLLRHPAFVEEGGDGTGKVGRDDLLDASSVHGEVVQSVRHRLGAPAETGTARRHPYEVAALAVGEQPGGVQPPSRPGRPENDRPGGVAEQDTRAPVGGIGDPGVQVGTDDQGVTAVGGDHPLGRGERVDEAAADRVEVEGRGGGGGPQQVVHERRRGRLGGIGGRGRHDDQGQVGGGDPRVLQGTAARGGGQVRGRLVVGGVATPVDAGLPYDPLVVHTRGCAHDLVGHHAGRQVGPRSQDSHRGYVRALCVFRLHVRLPRPRRPFGRREKCLRRCAVSAPKTFFSLVSPSWDGFSRPDNGRSDNPSGLAHPWFRQKRHRPSHRRAVEENGEFTVAGREFRDRHDGGDGAGPGSVRNGRSGRTARRPALRSERSRRCP